MKQETLDKLNSLTTIDQTVRIPSKEWESILLENFSRVVGGRVRYFQGVPIGAGVYKVKLLPDFWDKEFGTIQLDPKTEWITQGTGLVLKKNKTCGGC